MSPRIRYPSRSTPCNLRVPLPLWLPAQSAYPSAEYVDLGLKVKATPRLHGDDEVTLQLQFNISSLAGSSINGIPILSNETIEQTIRLRENETSVISGLIQSSDIRSISGLPWTSTVPGAGYLTGENTDTSQKTETFIVITPRALRLPPHNPRALYAGRGDASSRPDRPRRLPACLHNPARLKRQPG